MYTFEQILTDWQIEMNKLIHTFEQPDRQARMNELRYINKVRIMKHIVSVGKLIPKFNNPSISDYYWFMQTCLQDNIKWV